VIIFHDGLEELALYAARERQSDSFHQIPRGVLVELQVQGELSGSDPSLSVNDQVDRHKPLLERNAGAVKDGPDRDAEGGIAVVAVVASFFGD
jgi:hypothetical protein